MLTDFFVWLQSTAVATAIAGSVLLTGGLSGVHIISFALLLGSSLVASLRLTGAIFADRPVVAITDSTDRGIAVGLVISIVTGVLLFSIRASSAAENGVFQLKMGVLVASAAFHFGAHRLVVRQPSTSPSRLRATGIVGLALWTGVALAGCAFIFLE